VEVRGTVFVVYGPSGMTIYGMEMEAKLNGQDKNDRPSLIFPCNKGRLGFIKLEL
jgi:hypothetical protein